MAVLMNKKKKYGELLLDHQKTNPGPEDDVREYRKLIEREKITPLLIEAVEKALTQDYFRGRNFYISLIIKIEKIGAAPRFYAVPRLSCPTPHWRMSAFKYHCITSQLELLFSLPDEELGKSILAHKQEYLKNPTLGDMVKFVFLYDSGDLLKWVKKENREDDGPMPIITWKETEC